MNENRKILTALIVIGVLAVIVVGFVVRGRNVSPEVITEQLEVIEEVVIANTEVPEAEAQESADPTQDEVDIQEAVPTPRVGLESTDPSTVNLASGDLQLVEVFAFW